MKKSLQFLIKRTSWIIALLVLAISFSCQGPQGDRGPAGYDGYDGLDGVDGINYTRSAIFDIVPADWSGNLDKFNVYLDVPAINDDIYYDGAVLVYQLIEIDPISFNMLPYTYVDKTKIYYMDYNVFVGTIEVFIREIIEGINTTKRPDSLITFKVVIIEGISLSALQNRVNVKDYSEVMKFLEK